MRKKKKKEKTTGSNYLLISYNQPQKPKRHKHQPPLNLSSYPPPKRKVLQVLFPKRQLPPNIPKTNTAAE